MLGWFTDFLKWEGTAIGTILLALYVIGVFQI